MTDDAIREWAVNTWHEAIDAYVQQSSPTVLMHAARELLAMRDKKIIEKLRAIGTAHTYASENADLYRGFDTGIARAIEIIEATAIRWKP